MNNPKKYLPCSLALIILLIVVISCKDDFVSPASPSGNSIGSVVSASSNFNILAAALTKTNQAASLANNNSGIFTLFAPSDSAFMVYFQNKVGSKGTSTEDSVLLYIANMGTTGTLTINALSQILTYHIISSGLPSSALTGDGQVFSTLNGARLSISKTGSTFLLNANIAAFASVSGAKVEAVDNFAANGVIHTINRVLIPVSTASAASQLGIAVSYATNPPAITVSGTGTNYNIMANAIAITNLAPTILPNVSPLPDFTVFAPQDADFVTYLKDSIAAAGVTNEATAITFVKGLNATSTPTLTEFTDLIKNHIVAGRFLTTDFTGQNLGSLTTSFNITTDPAGKANGIPLVTKDILTNAGVVHVISGVLH